MVCEVTPRRDDAEKTLDVHSGPPFKHTPISDGLAYETLELYSLRRQYAFQHFELSIYVEYGGIYT